MNIIQASCKVAYDACALTGIAEISRATWLPPQYGTFIPTNVTYSVLNSLVLMAAKNLIRPLFAETHTSTFSIIATFTAAFATAHFAAFNVRLLGKSLNSSALKRQNLDYLIDVSILLNLLSLFSDNFGTESQSDFR